MSRSKKKPVLTKTQDSPGEAKFWKRLANRAVRASKDIADGSAYKKVFNSWKICDFKFWDNKNPKAKRK